MTPRFFLINAGAPSVATLTNLLGSNSNLFITSSSTFLTSIPWVVSIKAKRSNISSFTFTSGCT